MSTTVSIMLAILSSVFSALGQIGLKFGSMKLEIKIEKLLKNYALIAGFLFYGLSCITFVFALKGHELTVLYPVASLNYVWVNLLSMKLLNEKINIYKWSGIALIIAGVTLIV